MNQFQQPTPQAPRSSSDGCLKWLFIGCAGMLLLAVLAGISLYVMRWSLLDKGATWIVDAMLEQSNLSDVDKDSVRHNTKRIIAGWRDGKLEGKDFEAIFQQSPLVPAVMLRMMENGVKAAAGLADEEKNAFQTEASRVVRALEESKLNVDEAMKLIEDDFRPMFPNWKENRRPQHGVKVEVGSQKLDMTPDADVVRVKLPKIRQYLTEKGVPEGLYPYDFVKILNDLTDKLVGPK